MNRATHDRSLSEYHATVGVPGERVRWLRRLFAFAGPAYLVSVGYMDPGNWATDLAGGARFGYQLLWVLLMSNLMAVLLQTLSARLGVVTGKDLAQACRDEYPRWMALILWGLCEIAIVACDLAEVLGAAIGLKLLFHLPLLAGVCVTALDVLLLLSLTRFGMRRLEAFIVTLVATMGACFGIEILLARPDVGATLAGLLPRTAEGHLTLIARSPDGGWSVLGLHGASLYIAMGMLGATVMPHNLYLHSALVQSRAVADSVGAKRDACRLNLVDSVVALNAAFLVNAAILVLAAAVFHRAGLHDVARLEDAHRLLAPLLGTSIASTLFAVALLSSGQSSTITGTLAGQIVLEGFLRVRIQPWLRRLISRGLAIVPAALVIAIRGERAVDDLLVLSQVVLSLQLSFAVLPLVKFTSDRERMGEFTNPLWVVVAAIAVAVLILGLNVLLVSQQLGAWVTATHGLAREVLLLVLVPVLAVLAALLGLILAPASVRRLAPAALRARVTELPQWVAASAGALARRPAPPVAAEAGGATARRIAVALEMGPADAAVLAHVLAMPRRPDSEVVLVHVAESAASRYLGPETSDEESREDRAMLDRIAARLVGEGIAARAVLGHGKVAGEIARIVAEVDADLLVTGSHGHRLLGDLVHGATVSAVRHLVRCPVLTVRSDGKSA
jgi:manganese transport protein